MKYAQNWRCLMSIFCLDVLCSPFSLPQPRSHENGGGDYDYFPCFSLSSRVCRTVVYMVHVTPSIMCIAPISEEKRVTEEFSWILWYLFNCRASCSLFENWFYAVSEPWSIFFRFIYFFEKGSFATFLDAPSHLYLRVCRSVRPSISIFKKSPNRQEMIHLWYLNLPLCR